tara:strand:+ start:281 stop:1588 length:1308 start_codon:yes stop_codon:yes gene_type:complete
MLTSSKIFKGINGIVNIPGDKSISHRSIIIPSISNGNCKISNILMSEDVLNTLNTFKLMGVKIEKNGNNLMIQGKGLNSLNESKNSFHLGNSGTSARLLTGLLASQKFNSKLIGDESLSKRPMQRITEPLELMGARFKSNDNKLPLEIYGQNLKNIKYELKLPSAQVKSGIILAALNTYGKTEIIETNITRNHTEILLESFGANINQKKIGSSNIISIEGKKELRSKDISVPSDLSSAAFFIVAALINPNSKIKMLNINLNPTRDGIIIALKKMGAKIETSNKREINGELVYDIQVESSDLHGCELDESIAELMIDEYPILSVAAAYASSPSVFKGLKELKVKESDRLELIRYNLDNCGISCKVKEDNLYIDPLKKSAPKQNLITTENDHRIAMAFAVMGSKLGVDLKIKNPEFINTSFPNFSEKFNTVGGKVTE